MGSAAPRSRSANPNRRPMRRCTCTPMGAKRCSGCATSWTARCIRSTCAPSSSGDDTLGGEIVERLCAKARAGVRVRLMLDGLGRLIGRATEPEAAGGGGRRADALRAALAFAAEGPHQPARPPQAADRRRRARHPTAVERRAQPGQRVLRRVAGPGGVARPEFRPARARWCSRRVRCSNTIGRLRTGARRAGRMPRAPKHRCRPCLAPSSWRRARTRSTTPCTRCWSRPRTGPAGGLRSPRRTSFPTPRC